MALEDITVDLMNPLGVTQVEYIPNAQAQLTILQEAALQYERLMNLFNEIEREF